RRAALPPRLKGGNCGVLNSIPSWRLQSWAILRSPQKRASRRACPEPGEGMIQRAAPALLDRPLRRAVAAPEARGRGAWRLQVAKLCKGAGKPMTSLSRVTLRGSAGAAVRRTPPAPPKRTADPLFHLPLL